MWGIYEGLQQIWTGFTPPSEPSHSPLTALSLSTIAQAAASGSSIELKGAEEATPSSGYAALQEGNFRRVEEVINALTRQGVLTEAYALMGCLQVAERGNRACDDAFSGLFLATSPLSQASTNALIPFLFAKTDSTFLLKVCQKLLELDRPGASATLLLSTASLSLYEQRHDPAWLPVMPSSSPSLALCQALELLNEALARTNLTLVQGSYAFHALCWVKFLMDLPGEATLEANDPFALCLNGAIHFPHFESHPMQKQLTPTSLDWQSSYLRYYPRVELYLLRALGALARGEPLLELNGLEEIPHNQYYMKKLRQKVPPHIFIAGLYACLHSYKVSEYASGIALVENYFNSKYPQEPITADELTLFDHYIPLHLEGGYDLVPKIQSFITPLAFRCYRQAKKGWTATFMIVLRLHEKAREHNLAELEDRAVILATALDKNCTVTQALTGLSLIRLGKYAEAHDLLTLCLERCNSHAQDSPLRDECRLGLCESLYYLERFEVGAKKLVKIQKKSDDVPGVANLPALTDLTKLYVEKYFQIGRERAVKQHVLTLHTLCTFYFTLSIGSEEQSRCQAKYNQIRQLYQKTKPTTALQSVPSPKTPKKPSLVSQKETSPEEKAAAEAKQYQLEQEYKRREQEERQQEVQRRLELRKAMKMTKTVKKMPTASAPAAAAATVEAVAPKPVAPEEPPRAASAAAAAAAATISYIKDDRVGGIALERPRDEKSSDLRIRLHVDQKDWNRVENARRSLRNVLDLLKRVDHGEYDLQNPLHGYVVSRALMFGLMRMGEALSPTSSTARLSPAVMTDIENRLIWLTPLHTMRNQIRHSFNAISVDQLIRTCRALQALEEPLKGWMAAHHPEQPHNRPVRYRHLFALPPLCEGGVRPLEPTLCAPLLLQECGLVARLFESDKRDRTEFLRNFDLRAAVRMSISHMAECSKGLHLEGGLFALFRQLSRISGHEIAENQSFETSDNPELPEYSDDTLASIAMNMGEVRHWISAHLS